MVGSLCREETMMGGIGISRLFEPTTKTVVLTQLDSSDLPLFMNNAVAAAGRSRSVAVGAGARAAADVVQPCFMAFQRNCERTEHRAFKNGRRTGWGAQVRHKCLMFTNASRALCHVVKQVTGASERAQRTIPCSS